MVITGNYSLRRRECDSGQDHDTIEERLRSDPWQIYMASRKQNERDYPFWEDLPNGGRRYWRERPGGDFGFCRYVKTVDENETTLSFIQQVYDDDGNLIEIHQKYPADTGHQTFKSEGNDDDDITDSSE
jgi:hypothetical protein